MSEPTDAQRLLARGVSVELANGASHEFRFTARTVARIENDYGSFDAFAAAMRAKPINSLAYVIHVTLGVSQDDAVDLIDTRRLNEFSAAMNAAINEAFPEADVKVQILQNHTINGQRYRAGTTVDVSSERAKHLVDARVAEIVEGNAKAAPASSPGAAFSASPSSAGTSTPSASGT